VVTFSPVPWELRVDPGRRVSHVRMTETVTFDDFLEMLLALKRHPEFDPAFALLLDLRAAHDLDITSDQLDTIIAQTPIAASAPRAIIVGNLVVSAIVRVYQFLRQDMTNTPVTRVCQSLDEAWQWLGIRPYDTSLN